MGDEEETKPLPMDEGGEADFDASPGDGPAAGADDAMLGGGDAMGVSSMSLHT